MSFKDLKRNSKAQFEKLNQELTKLNSGGFNNVDDRMWKCQTDKAGNGYAIIRFLPTPDGEDVPFIKMFSYSFKGPGGWYIENARSTLGSNEKDPPYEYTQPLWATGADADKIEARKYSRSTSFYSNIYVVKDPANPENEGKVFLYRYGKKIFDKINDLMNPQFADEEKRNPFDFWEGANFKLKVRQVEGYPNYEKSEFETSAPLLDSDDEMEEIYGKLYSLTDLISPDKFKSYDDLKKRFDKVMGVETSTRAPARSSIPAQAEDDLPWDSGKSSQAAAEPKIPESKFDAAADDDDDDDGLAFFRDMADD